MITKELIEYIKAEKVKGVPEMTTKEILVKTGWGMADIDDVYASLSVSAEPVALKVTVPIISTPVFSNPVNIDSPSESVVVTHHKSKLLIIAVAVILALLGGGGAYAYFTGYFVSPEKVIADALASYPDVHSVSFDTTITVDMTGLKSATPSLGMFLPANILSQKLILTNKGSFDRSDAKNIKLDTNVSFDIGALSGVVDLRMIEDTLYANMIKAPSLPMFPQLSEYENKWFSFPHKAEPTYASGLLTQTVTGVDATTIKNLTEEQKDHIHEMTTNAHFIKVTKKLTPETIVGESSYHFLFDLDVAGIKAYLQDLKEYIHTIGKDSSALSAFDPTSFNERVDSIKDFAGEVWIGKSDNLPRKIEFNFSVINKNNPDGGAVKVTFVNISKDWNVPAVINTPTESVPFETFISEITGQSMASAKQKGEEAMVKSLTSTVRPQAVLYFDAHNDAYTGFCSSAELRSMKADMASKSEVSKLACKDAKTTFVAFANFTAGDFYCVDSTGFASMVPTMPKKSLCQE